MAKRLLVRRGTSKRLPRKESIRLTLNEREFKAICDHCAEHHITDRTGWIRELVISHILIESEPEDSSREQPRDLVARERKQ